MLLLCTYDMYFYVLIIENFKNLCELDCCDVLDQMLGWICPFINERTSLEILYITLLSTYGSSVTFNLRNTLLSNLCIHDLFWSMIRVKWPIRFAGICFGSFKYATFVYLWSKSIMTNFMSYGAVKVKGNPNSQGILNWIQPRIALLLRRQHKNIENSQIIEQNLVIPLCPSLCLLRLALPSSS